MNATLKLTELIPGLSVGVEMNEAHRLILAEVERLREAVREYAQHQSWRCEHAPHYYLVEPPTDDCACGYDKTMRGLNIEPA